MWIKLRLETIDRVQERGTPDRICIFYLQTGLLHTLVKRNRAGEYLFMGLLFVLNREIHLDLHRLHSQKEKKITLFDKSQSHNLRT